MPFTNSRGVRRVGLLPFLIFFCSLALASAAQPENQPSLKRDKCPVCGMFVDMFADWNAVIEFADGRQAVFDGAKDMFKYYLDIRKYDPLKGKSAMQAISVKDYYSKESIDARQAFFVIWSDVYGPMGHEPIPFEKEADAKKFLKEHKGKQILRFKNITSRIIVSLDNP